MQWNRFVTTGMPYDHTDSGASVCLCGGALVQNRQPRYRRNAAIWAVSRFAVSNIRCTLRLGAFTFFCDSCRVQCSWFCKEEEKRKKRKHTQTNSCPVRMHWIMVILDRCGSSDRKLRFYAPAELTETELNFFLISFAILSSWKCSEPQQKNMAIFTYLEPELVEINFCTTRFVACSVA